MLTNRGLDTCLKPGNPCEKSSDCCVNTDWKYGAIQCSTYPELFKENSVCISLEQLLKPMPGDKLDAGAPCTGKWRCKNGGVCSSVMQEWPTVCHAKGKYEAIRVLEGGYCHEAHTPCDQGLMCMQNTCVPTLK